MEPAGGLIAAAAPLGRELGIVAVVLLTCGAFAARSPRARAFCVLGALALTPVLLVGELWDTQQFDRIRDRPGTIAIGSGAGLVAIAALAALFARRAWLLPVVAVAALPFRLPVEAGGQTANLLIPLYLVVAAGGLAYSWQRLRGGKRTIAPLEREPGGLELALALAVLLYALQAAYSTDFERALENVVFFYVPFALLLKLLAAAEWSRQVALTCGAVALALAAAFVGIGFFEYATRELFLNPKVIESNQFETYFRVNSLFFDPNIYGRFLALVIIGLAAVLLWGRRGRDVLGATLAIALLWGGLLLTFSQSSFAALLVGLAVLAALRWGPGRVAVTAVVAACVAGAAILAAPGLIKLDLRSERSLDDATSGRVRLMRGGLEQFADRPLTGFGSGSFEERFREREEVGSEEAAAASHTIPITIAAEQGLVGLAAYAAILWAAWRALYAGLGRLRPRRRRAGEPDDERPPPWLVARGAVAAGFAALVFHTLLYAAFLEDPLAWTIIGAGIALRAVEPVPDARSRAAARRAAKAERAARAARTRTGTSSP